MAPIPESGHSNLVNAKFSMAPVLLRVMEEAGYVDAPIYNWVTVPQADQMVTRVSLMVPALAQSCVWVGWDFTEYGLSLEEVANRAAFRVLRELMLNHPEVLDGTPAASFPRCDPRTAKWAHNGPSGSTGDAMNAMFAVMQMMGQTEDRLQNALAVIDQQRTEMDELVRERRKMHGVVRRAAEAKSVTSKALGEKAKENRKVEYQCADLRRQVGDLLQQVATSKKDVALLNKGLEISQGETEHARAAAMDYKERLIKTECAEATVRELFYRQHYGNLGTSEDEKTEEEGGQ